MSALAPYLELVIDFACRLLILLLLLRFHISGSPYEVMRIHAGLCTATNWLVAPLAKLAGRIWGMELAALIAALLVAIVQEFAFYTLNGYKLLAQPSLSLTVLGARGALQLLFYVLHLYTFVLIAGVVLSWLQLRNPAVNMIQYFAGRLLYPFRKLVRPVGGIDFSPVLALLVLQLLATAAHDVIANLGRIF